jgi:hypothetical protein
MTWLVKKLNFHVDLKEFEEYYNMLQSDYEHLRWDFAKCQHEIKEEWQERIRTHYGAERGWGWAIQSNLVDIDLPCPPYNISTHPRCEYRNTSMAQGLILRLQALMPWARRWSLFVQLPGGTVPRHTDDHDEYTGHIPLFWDKEAVFEIGWDEDKFETVTLPPGGVYLIDTLVPHATFNRSEHNRVGIVFRFNRKHLPELLEVTGQI